MIWFYLSAAAMVLTAVAHSYFGEKRLIIPILAIDAQVTQRPLARQVIRFAWHFTSLFMISTAVFVLWPGVPQSLVLLTGLLWLGAGVFDAIMTKGKHIGWPLITAAGIFALIGVVV